MKIIRRWRKSRFDINGDYVSAYSDWVSIVTKYDSLGNKSERIGYNKWEDINFIIKYRTDINGVEEAIKYDKDNNIKSESYTKHDSNGNIIQAIQYGANDKRANKLVHNYLYNSDNKQTQMTTECNYDCYEYGYYGKEQNFYI